VLNRLHTVTYPGTTVTYTYDSMGNRLNMVTSTGNTSSTIAYTYDAGDQLLSAGGTTYTYDNDGNRIEKDASSGISLYGYDGANRLSSVSVVGGPLLTFAYDGDGNRIDKEVISGNTTENTNYVWDVNGGLPQVLTEAADGQGTSVSLYGLQRISMTNSSGGQTYYQYDGLGSVRSLSDSSGNSAATYSYDAFGNTGVTTGSVDNDFLFTGEQMDAETGLIYLRARYYDPETGRFISRDPATSISRYTYGYNNPVRFTDPSGRGPEILLPGAIGAGVNEGFYLGVEVGTLHHQYSEVTAIGRGVGGFIGGESWIGGPVGAVIGGGAGYYMDIQTQEYLSSRGYPGTPESFSWEKMGISMASAGIGNRIGQTFVPGESIGADFGESVLGNTYNTFWLDWKDWMNFGINSGTNKGTSKSGK